VSRIVFAKVDPDRQEKSATHLEGSVRDEDFVSIVQGIERQPPKLNAAGSNPARDASDGLLVSLSLKVPTES
jgi:hypothetical protein